MDDILLQDATERYLKDEMSQQERTFFEELRKNNPALDQLVVDHIFFLSEVEKYGDTKNFRHSLYEVETKLAEEGFISNGAGKGSAKVVFLWKKFKRTTAVAATIAGIVSLLTVVVASMYTTNKSNKEIIKLSNDVQILKAGQSATNKALIEVKKDKADPKATFKSGGTGFLIDSKGYLITNAHVLKGKTIVATNDQGQQFIARICMKDMDRDIAVLKIEDKDFIPYNSLPYNINKSVKLAEPIYTMGYPKDQIVYGEGYLSSETGYKGDTLTYQISIPAEHGNSGGPVLNKKGEIIGILTDKLESGSVFAVKSIYIFKAVENLKKNPAFSDIKLNSTNAIKKLQREEQVEKVNTCVFLIKSYE